MQPEGIRHGARGQAGPECLRSRLRMSPIHRAGVPVPFRRHEGQFASSGSVPVGGSPRSPPIRSSKTWSSSSRTNCRRVSSAVRPAQQRTPSSTSALNALSHWPSPTAPSSHRRRCRIPSPHRGYRAALADCRGGGKPPCVLSVTVSSAVSSRPGSAAVGSRPGADDTGVRAVWPQAVLAQRPKAVFSSLFRLESRFLFKTESPFKSSEPTPRLLPLFQFHSVRTNGSAPWSPPW